MRRQAVVCRDGRLELPAAVIRDLSLEAGDRLTLTWPRRPRRLIVTVDERHVQAAVRIPPAGCLRDAFPAPAASYVSQLRREAESKPD